MEKFFKWFVRAADIKKCEDLTIKKMKYQFCNRVFYGFSKSVLNCLYGSNETPEFLLPRKKTLKYKNGIFKFNF